jgi:hypothetical protein
LLSGCVLHEEPEQEPYYHTPNQIRGAITYQAKAQNLKAQAEKASESTPVMWFDLTQGVCKNPHSQSHQEAAGLQQFVLHSAVTSYIPEEQYTEIAYYCQEDLIWYYRYVSRDRKKNILLGPFLIERSPVGGGFEGPKGPPR